MSVKSSVHLFYRSRCSPAVAQSVAHIEACYAVGSKLGIIASVAKSVDKHLLLAARLFVEEGVVVYIGAVCLRQRNGAQHLVAVDDGAVYNEHALRVGQHVFVQSLGVWGHRRKLAVGLDRCYRFLGNGFSSLCV